MSKSKINFVLASITDIQNAIRALDNKLIAILVLILFPVSKLDTIVTVYKKLIQFSSVLGYISLIIFIISWLSSILYTVIGLLALDNPEKHIQNPDKCDGTFYGIGLFKSKWYNFLFNSNAVTSITFKSYMEKFDLSDDSIFRELVFEQSKLVFIRSLKLKRHRIAIISVLVSILIGLLSWTVVLIVIYK